MLRLLSGLGAVLALSGIVALHAGEPGARPAPLPEGLVPANTAIETAAFVCFLEGPAVDGAGNVFFSDIAVGFMKGNWPELSSRRSSGAGWMKSRTASPQAPGFARKTLKKFPSARWAADARRARCLGKNYRSFWMK